MRKVLVPAEIKADAILRRMIRSARRLMQDTLVVVLFFGSMSAAGIAKADPGDTLSLRQEDVALYKQPDEASAVVRQLRTGDRLLEFRRQDGWIRVATHRVLGWGWVRAEDVILVPQPPQEPEDSIREGPGKPDGWEQGADAEPFQFPLLLDVDGTPAVEFRGECLLVTRDGREVRRSFADAIPTEFKLEAVAASCRVNKTDSFGRLGVRLIEDDRVLAWATTTAPFNSVNVRSRGPWGVADASRGYGALITAPVRHAAPHGHKTRLNLGPRSIPGFRSRR